VVRPTGVDWPAYPDEGMESHLDALDGRLAALGGTISNTRKARRASR